MRSRARTRVRITRRTAMAGFRRRPRRRHRTGGGRRPTPTAPNGRTWTATPLTLAGMVIGAKSPSGQLAKSDPALVNSTSSKQVRVVVKLDYDSLAATAAASRVSGYQPGRHRQRLESGVPTRPVRGHIAAIEDTFLGATAQKVPSATGRPAAAHRLRRRALSVPANQVARAAEAARRGGGPAGQTRRSR